MLPLIPLVWDQGSGPEARKLAIGVNVDLACLPGPPGFFGGPWIQVNGGHISGADIAAWPYSVGILIGFTSFLNTLHWPTGSDDFGHFGISFLELLILLLSNGLVTGCFVKGLPGLMSGLIVPF